MKSLGASHVFDRKDSNVTQKILKLMKPGDVVFDCAAKEDTQAICTEIVNKLGGGNLPMVLPPLPHKYDNIAGEFRRSNTVI